MRFPADFRRDLFSLPPELLQRLERRNGATFRHLYTDGCCVTKVVEKARQLYRKARDLGIQQRSGRLKERR
jgi:hypothetical protein